MTTRQEGGLFSKDAAMPLPAPGPVVSHPGLKAPGAAVVSGAGAALERLDPARHGADLAAAALSMTAERWRFMPYGPFADDAAFSAWLAARAASSDPLFYAVRPEGGPAQGMMSFMRLDPPNGALEIGHIWLTDAFAASRAATAAFYQMIRHPFEDLGARRLEWKCDSRNAPSRRAAERLGFRFEGVFRQHLIVKGRNRDTAWFSMLDSEWPLVRAAFEAWLSPANFDGQGRRREGLSDIRARLS